MKNELIAGVAGTALGVVGTATQTNEILETISLVITILGALVSFVLVPLLNWYRSAKKDGKITLDEVQDGAETLKDGLDKTKEEITKERKGKSEDD